MLQGEGKKSGEKMQPLAYSDGDAETAVDDHLVELLRDLLRQDQAESQQDLKQAGDNPI